jgi:hypothetical protein
MFSWRPQLPVVLDLRILHRGPGIRQLRQGGVALRDKRRVVEGHQHVVLPEMVALDAGDGLHPPGQLCREGHLLVGYDGSAQRDQHRAARGLDAVPFCLF